MKEVTRSTIKWIAMITMFIDHLRWTVVLGSGTYMNVFRQVLFGIGRLAFPLFGFLLVDGFYRTRSREKFFIRLFIMACLSEVPYDMMRFHHMLTFEKQNVMWTLLFAFGAMWLIEGIRDKFKEKKRFCYLLQALVSVTALAFGYLAHTDYGYIGVATVLMIYFCKKAEPMFPVGFPIRADMMGYIAAVMLLLASNEWEITALPGIFLIWNYHGKPGIKIPKVVGYGFYPVHMLLLLTIGGLIYPKLNIISMFRL